MDTEKLREIQARMESLQAKQNDFTREITELKREISKLTGTAAPAAAPPPPFPPATETPPIAVWTRSEPYQARHSAPRKDFVNPPPKRPIEKSDWEKFIGENLINKIGIVITVIGVAIGAKYSIDHNLISPLTRIILGYFAGISLLLIGFRLKKNYENYSAVLVSGAMAIMYFITFAAYAIFGLIPQTLAFVMMVLFTAFTVFAAVQYNLQVIAHIGLVGAYAVPFLLSDGSGRVAILFSYMAVINAGVLVLSFRKYWKPLFYSAFGLTWLIFLSWRMTGYLTDKHFTLALLFGTIFFITFYTAFLAYKLVKQEKFNRSDIILILLNSFIYFAAGYSIVESHEYGSQFVGAFTLCNAILHFVVCTIVYRRRLADKNLFHLVAGLVLVFITIAVPVQLNGDWVTLLWAGEAALLFWVGKTRNVSFYEKLSYPMMLIAFISLCDDWSSGYSQYFPGLPYFWIRPILNIHFLTSMLFIVAFAFINFIYVKKPSTSLKLNRLDFSKFISLAIPAILLIAVYNSFRLEIFNYFIQLYRDSELNITKADEHYHYLNSDYKNFASVWVVNYSLFFVSVLTFFNILKLKNNKLASINIILNLIAIGFFLTQGLYDLSELRETYISQTNAEYFYHGPFNLGIRYVSVAFAALAVFSCYRYLKSGLVSAEAITYGELASRAAFDFVLHITILWTASSELIHWLDLGGSSDTYKLGLSILWGSYSLFLIALGIWKRKQHLRIGAICLFAVTLIKLFFYDISHLDTISKTVVFVSLGVLLLVISFLYNKYKHELSNDQVR